MLKIAEVVWNLHCLGMGSVPDLDLGQYHHQFWNLHEEPIMRIISSFGLWKLKNIAIFDLNGYKPRQFDSINKKGMRWIM